VTVDRAEAAGDDAFGFLAAGLGAEGDAFAGVATSRCLTKLRAAVGLDPHRIDEAIAPPAMFSLSCSVSSLSGFLRSTTSVFSSAPLHRRLLPLGSISVISYFDFIGQEAHFAALVGFAVLEVEAEPNVLPLKRQLQFAFSVQAPSVL